MIRLYVILLFSQLVFAQNDSEHTFILPIVKITQNEKGKSVVYKFDKDQNKFTVKNDFLSPDTNMYNYRANISDITKVTFINNPNMAHVLIISFMAGALIGAAVTGYDFHSGGNNASTGERITGALIVGGIVSMLAGGIAWLISPDKEYYLKEKDHVKKRNHLLKILEANKVK